MQETYNPTHAQLAQMLASSEVESNNFRRRSDWRRRWKRATGNYPSAKSYKVIHNIDGPVWAPRFF